MARVRDIIDRLQLACQKYRSCALNNNPLEAAILISKTLEACTEAIVTAMLTGTAHED